MKRDMKGNDEKKKRKWICLNHMKIKEGGKRKNKEMKEKEETNKKKFSGGKNRKTAWKEIMKKEEIKIELHKK